MQFGYRMIPKQLSFSAYEYILQNSGEIMNAYGVTILTTVIGTALSVAVIAMYAYPISRKDFRYKKSFTFFVFFTMIFNGGMVPWYIVCTNILHIGDTLSALILPYIISAWYVIVMRTFFATTIPDAIIESARIDGAGDFRTFCIIVMPLSLPGLATIALFSTLRYWNDWWLPLMLINNPALSNLQYYLYRIIMNIQVLAENAAAGISQAEMINLPQESARMAMCIIAIGPIILAYPFFQKYFIKGLTIGSVKG